MTESPKIIAKPSLYLFVLSIVMGIAAISIGIMLYLLEGTKNLGMSVVAACFITPGLYLLYAISNIHVLIVYADKVTLKSIFGFSVRDIYLADITSWTEIKKMRGKSPRPFKHLTLYTERGRYLISSETYSDYSKVKQYLTWGKQRSLADERKWHRLDNLKFAVFCLLGSLALFYRAYLLYVQIDWSFIVLCTCGLMMIIGAAYFYNKKV